MKSLVLLIYASFLLFCSSAFSDIKISFPEEELSSEAVLPVFEKQVAVRNRKVNHKGKFEINLMGGMVASEPIYNPFNYGLSLTYHFNNTQAIHFMGVLFMDGLSASGESLRNGEVFDDGSTISGVSFDATKAPSKQMFVGVNYQYTAYYGKISLGRDNIMHLTLGSLLGLGAYKMEGLTLPSLNGGITQRLYFGPRFALRFDILFSAYQGPDITSAGPLRKEDPGKPDPGKFSKTVQFDSNIFLGLSVLL